MSAVVRKQYGSTEVFESLKFGEVLDISSETMKCCWFLYNVELKYTRLVYE